MPQFDFVLYFPMFIIFIIYSFILYIILSLFFIPFFWNIFYFRYLKKNYNKFLNYIYDFFLENLVEKSNNSILLFNNLLDITLFTFKHNLSKLLSIKLFLYRSISFLTLSLLLKTRKKEKPVKKIVIVKEIIKEEIVKEEIVKEEIVKKEEVIKKEVKKKKKK